MADSLFAMTLLGMVMLAALAPAGTADTAPDLFLPPGSTLQTATAIYEDVVVLGTLVLDEGAVLVARTVHVLAGGRIEAASGAPGGPAFADVAVAAHGDPGADLRIEAASLTVAADAHLIAGSGGAGGLAIGQSSATGGAGGHGGSIVLQAATVVLDGTVLPGAGGQGGHAVAVVPAGPDQPVHAAGGAGGNSGRVVINGVEGVASLPAVAAPMTTVAEAPTCALIRSLAVDCELPDASDLVSAVLEWLPSGPIRCPSAHTAELVVPAEDCLPDVKPVVDQAVKTAQDCVDEAGLGLSPKATTSSLSLGGSQTVTPCAAAGNLRAWVDATVETALSEVDKAKEEAQPLVQTCRPANFALALLPGWSSCNELAMMVVDGVVDSAMPGLPGLPGLTEAECATPNGAAGQQNLLGDGGPGGDACVKIVGEDGGPGEDGHSGVIGCSAGGAGGNGGEAGAAVANGGAGGMGQRNGGAGGSATASAKGGNGGDGGAGGTRWGDPDCPGGPGGAGGVAGDATANGGKGGDGVCGVGGDGGVADASATGGSGGTGGAGTPPGAPGAPGGAGVGTATPGAGGFGPGVCP